MRAGQPLSHVISFASGEPDADVSWQLLDTAGTVKQSGVLSSAPGAVSGTIDILALSNTLPNGQLLGSRDLTWSYTVGGISVNGSVRYQLEGTVPFFASEAGVRNMLGLGEVEDLSDEDIALVRGYLEFEQLVGAAKLAPLLSGSGYEMMIISEGIEAQAALRLLPTLQVRVAKRETSGTNQYDRQDIDWVGIQTALATKVRAASIVVDPALDVVSSSSSALLVLVTPNFNLFPDG